MESTGRYPAAAADGLTDGPIDGVGSSDHGEGRARPLPSYALPLLLVGGFRVIVDALHRELAEHGHPELRPVHGFALQAVNQGAATVADLARGSGVSKQAAAKTAAWLERAGYLRRIGHPHDGRSQLLQLTARGREALRISAEVLDRQHQAWGDVLGVARLDVLERSLVDVVGVPNLAGQIDFPSWLGQHDTSASRRRRAGPGATTPSVAG